MEEKKDSIIQKVKKATSKTVAPQIIRETKIIEKEVPQKDGYELNKSKNTLLKKGEIEINVPNAEDAKYIVQEYLTKYDGVLKSENSTSYNEHKITYLKTKVPIQKFDYFIEELSSQLGEVVTKNIESSGYNFINNTFCDVEITLNEKPNTVGLEDENKTFTEQTSDAIGSGWEVVKKIFLFILPFWPIFLIGGLGYYFFKKKNKKTNTNYSIEDKKDDIA